MRSNGYTNSFQKIDSLFYTEYAGKKSSTKTAIIDTSISSSIMQFENSFGFTSKTLKEADSVGKNLIGYKKLYSSNFYVHTDGTLQVPTNTLFFQPKNDATVFSDFAKYGLVEKHSAFKGFYYLHLNTSVYNNGDTIFSLCDKLYRKGIVLTVEPVFIRMIKPKLQFEHCWPEKRLLHLKNGT